MDEMNTPRSRNEMPATGDRGSSSSKRRRLLDSTDESGDEEACLSTKRTLPVRDKTKDGPITRDRSVSQALLLDSEEEKDGEMDCGEGDDYLQQSACRDKEGDVIATPGKEILKGDGPNDMEEEDDNEHHPTDPRLRDSDRTPSNLHRLMTRNGESRLVMVLTRRWISDSTPEAPGRGCAMYLPVQPAYFGPLMLIQQHTLLQEMALTRGGNREYAEKIAKTFHRHRRKAKAQYNRSLALALFTKGEPHCIAHNVLKGGEGEMELSPATAHLESTDALQKLIGSPMLYTDPALHELWVSVHASGKVYGATSRDSVDRLDSFLSVNYEAHGRLEVKQRLQYQGFRHGSTRNYLSLQAKEFKKMKKIVREDRRTNLEQVSWMKLRALNLYVNVVIFVLLCLCLHIYRPKTSELPNCRSTSSSGTKWTPSKAGGRANPVTTTMTKATSELPRCLYLS